MIYMYRVGFIGDYDSICGFAALGVDIFVCNRPTDAAQTARTLSKSDYGIIFMTEACFAAAAAEIDAAGEAATTAFIPIPSAGVSPALGRERMKRCVERAVGADIIYND